MNPAADEAGSGCLAEVAGAAAAGIEHAREGVDSGQLHQLRIVLARLMADLRVVERLGPSRPVRGLRREARWLRRRLGVARDWDVYMARRRARGGAGRDPGMEAAAAHAQLLGRDRISLAVRSRRCHTLVTALRRLEQDGKAAAWTPSAAAARRHVSRQLRRIRRQSRDCGRLGARQLHRLRARVRSLRYACEFLAGKLGAGAPAYIAALTTLQQTLGRLNDSYIIYRLAQSVAPAAGAPWLERLGAGHLAEVARLRHRLHIELKALQDLGLPQPD